MKFYFSTILHGYGLVINDINSYIFLEVCLTIHSMILNQPILLETKPV